MKEIWKRTGSVMLLCLLTGAFCACQRGQETNVTVTPAGVTVTLVPTLEVTGMSENTKVPSVTENLGNCPTGELCLTVTPVPTDELRPTFTPIPTEEPLPTPTPEPEEERIPIDEAHFTSAKFREVIAENYDTDMNGFLSASEREAVTEIWIDGRDYENQYNHFEEECLDGFEYFPNLINVDVSFTYVGQVAIRNHPSLQRFDGTEGGVEILQIENCPSLTRIGFYIYDISSISVVGAPLASVSLGDNCSIRSMTFDADMTLRVLDSRFGEGSTMYKICEDGSLVYEYYDYGEHIDGNMFKHPLKQSPVKFTNQKEPQTPFSEEYWTECLENSEFSELDLFTIRISEKEEELYNEKGQKAWDVCVAYTRSENSREGESGEETFLVYAEEMPGREQLVFRPAVIHQREALEYSPNRGVRILTEWDLKLVYRNGEEEQEIGVLRDHEHYCTITADGTVKAILSYERWRKREW